MFFGVSGESWNEFLRNFSADKQLSRVSNLLVSGFFNDLLISNEFWSKLKDFFGGSLDNFLKRKVFKAKLRKNNF